MKEIGMARAKWLVGLALIAVIAAACSSGGASSAPSAAPASEAPASVAPSEAASAAPSEAATYRIGYSNGGGVGNGFREEQVCTAKAEALASGQVAELDHDPPQHRRSRPAAGHPRPDRGGRRRDRLQPERSGRPQPGARRGRGSRHQDRLGRRVTSPTPATYNLYNNQDRVRATSAPSGCSSSSAARATSGTPAASPAIRPTPTATPASSGHSLRYPGITVVPSAEGVHTDWDPATATQLANEFISSGGYDDVQGIWTSGMDSQVVDAVKAAGKTVRADRRRGPRRLREPAPHTSRACRAPR